MKEEKKIKEEKKAVFLPAELHGRIEERVRATEFRSVEEYVTYVMEEILREEESEEEEPTFSEEEEEEVKKRLRALGYLE
jgi:Arc/MetJ-type ribon-helix-helix transcriptional regulator